jgi:glycosyltransferase involved in cell wall biosynthesis
MKILHVMAGAPFGGAETAFVDMCIAMHEAGEHIEVVTRENPIRVPRLQEAGITVHTLKFGGKIDVFTTWSITKIIKNFQPDIVQCWMSRAPSKVPSWKASMKIPRYHVVSRLGSPYKLKYFKSSDYFITITPEIAEYLVENGVERSRVRHVNNFAEVERPTSHITRADYDTPEGVPLLLGLGRLHDDKAFDTLIKVAAELPEVYVWIAGEGPLRGALERLIENLALGDRVKLIGWQTDRARLFELVDICTFISRNEGFGTVFVQSWAQRVPVVVSDADGPRQFVKDGQDGLMAPIDDVQAIKSCIRRLLDEPDLENMLVHQGYLRYEREFTKAACLQGYLQFYHDISASD